MAKEKSMTEAMVETAILMMRPSAALGFNPTPPQLERYNKSVDAVRRMLSELIAPPGFTADEWAICRAYLLADGREGVFREGSTPSKEDLEALTSAFKTVWPKMWDKLAAHMGEFWAKAEQDAASIKKRIVVDDFSVITNPDDGTSTITLTDKDGNTYLFTSAYPVDIKIDLPDNGAAPQEVIFGEDDSNAG